MSNKKDLPSQIRFSPSLSLWQAIARGLGVIVTGVAFVLLGSATNAAGPLTPLAILLTTLLMLFNCLGYAELAVGAPRPGGAYILIHDGTGGRSLAFLAGWALALSELGLCGLLAQGAAKHLSPLLLDPFGITVPANLLALGLLVLLFLESGLGRWNKHRPPFSLPTVILLVALALVAAPRLPAADYAATPPQPELAITLLAAGFVGLEAVSSRQREIRRRTTNLPRALLLTSVLTAAVGIGLAVAAGSHTTQVPGNPLAPLGEAIAGPAGNATVLVVGAIVLTLSLRQALRTTVRHLYVMAQDGFWPRWLRQVHSQHGTPVRAILLATLLTMPIIWIPAKLLSQMSGLFYLLVLMAINLTLIRRPRKTPPPFALPFHPWVPALTLAADALIIPLWGLLPAACTAGCLAIGAAIYLFYGRSRHIEAKEGIIVFRPPQDSQAPERFRVLAPIANPTTASALLRTAGRLAQFQGGDVLALQITTVPEPVPLEAGRLRAEADRLAMEKALAIINEEKLPIQTMTRVSRGVAQGILGAAIEESVDLIVLEWKGPTHPRSASLGRVADAVLRNAPCDVLIMHGEHADHIKKILVPTAGGPHAQSAAQLASLLAKTLQAEVTLLYVQTRPTTAKQMEENRHTLSETADGLSMSPPPEKKMVTAPSAAEGIIQEAQGHDLVLLGVSDEALLDQLVFGSVPLRVAARIPHTALMQSYRGVTKIWTRRLIHTLRQTLPTLSAEEQLEVRRELGRGAQPGINFFVLTVLSCLIAALGLLLNSPAVVIGAMLVGPLMSPIMGFSLGLVLGDIRLIRFSVEAILKGITLAVIIAAFIGLISPLKTVTEAMLSNSQPTLLDMAVALASGLAGAYAMARKDVSAALPGVAIAASLMPPLAALGLALSLGDMRVAGGAFLLFLTNIAAISLAAGVVFLLLGIRPQSWGAESRRQLRQRLCASLLLLLTIAIPLGIIMADIVQDATQEQVTREAITQYLGKDSQLVSLEIEKRETDLFIVATVRSTQSLDQGAADELAGTLSDLLHRPVQLEVVFLPIVRSGPTPIP